RRPAHASRIALRRSHRRCRAPRRTWRANARRSAAARPARRPAESRRAGTRDRHAGSAVSPWQVRIPVFGSANLLVDADETEIGDAAFAHLREFDANALAR